MRTLGQPQFMDVLPRSVSIAKARKCSYVFFILLIFNLTNSLDFDRVSTVLLNNRDHSPRENQFLRYSHYAGEETHVVGGQVQSTTD